MKNEVSAYLNAKLSEPKKSCVGIELTKYLRKWNLVNLEKDINSFSNYFQKGYVK